MSEPSTRPDSLPADATRPNPKILAQNRAALANHPATIRMLEGVEPYGSDAVEFAKSGDAIPVLTDSAGVRRPLHSRHQPRDEAKRALDDEIDGLAVVAFVGAGFGYGPLGVMSRLGRQNMVVWIESDARLFRTALEWVDLRPVLDHAGTRLWIGCDPREIHERMRAEITRILTGSLDIVRHPASFQREPERYREYTNAIQNFAREGAVSVRTTFYLSRFSAKNQAGNLGAYVASPGIEFLRGALQGEPAILVSAGPSLRNSLDTLAKLEGRVTMLAVSTALRPVVEHGIRPDFTALIDYHRISKRYFDGLDPALDIPLVCDLKASSAAVRAHAGPVLFANDLVMNTVFDGIFGDRGQATQGSTVAHIAFRFLAHLGADPIVLVGQDLSYPGGLIHVPGTAIQAQEFPSSHRFYSLEMRELEYYFASRQKFRLVPSNSGGDVPTDEVFFTYLQEFERIFADHPGTVLNATERGACISGSEIVDLREVLDRYVDRRRPDLRAVVRERCEDQRAAELAGRALTILETRKVELRKLKSIYDRILKLLARVIRANEFGNAADDLVRKVHHLHQDAKTYKLLYLYLSHLAQSDSWQRIRADRRLEATNLDGIEKQLYQARRDQDYVKALREACDFARDCFERGRASIRSLVDAPVGLIEPGSDQ